MFLPTATNNSVTETSGHHASAETTAQRSFLMGLSGWAQSLSRGVIEYDVSVPFVEKCGCPSINPSNTDDG